MKRLAGKVCVITGAGGGMGADAAHLFTEEGARVCVADVDVDAAAKVASEVDGLSVQVDVADEGSVQRMFLAAASKFGGSHGCRFPSIVKPVFDLKTDLRI